MLRDRKYNEERRRKSVQVDNVQGFKRSVMAVMRGSAGDGPFVKRLDWSKMKDLTQKGKIIRCNEKYRQKKMIEHL